MVQFMSGQPKQGSYEATEYLKSALHLQLKRY